MALTSSSNYLDDLARRRAQAEQLRATMQQASTQGIGALQTEVGRQQNERDAGLRLRAQEATEANATRDDERATQQARDAIRLKNIESRDATTLRGIEASAAREAAERAQKNTDADRAIRMAPIEAAQKDAARAEQQRALDAYVGTLDGGRIDETAAAEVATRLGVSIEQVRASVNAAANARSDKSAATDLNTRKTEAQIAVDEAQAAKLRRPPVSAAPKPPSAFDQARIDALNEKRDAATSDAVADVQGADKRLERIDRMIAEAPNFNTGPVADTVADIATTVLPEGMKNPEAGGIMDAIMPDAITGLPARSEWKSRVARNFNEVLKERSGASVTTQEMARALAEMVHTGLDDSEFLLRAKELRDSYAQDLENAKQRMTPRARAQAAAPVVGTVSPEAVGMSDDEANALLDKWLNGG